MMPKQPSVEIAGGGLAGLAGAVAFAERGWATRVWERAPTMREIGAGLYVWENGLRTLAALGVYEELARSAHQVRGFDVRDERLRIVESFHYSHEPGNRLLTMPRPALHTALYERARSLGVEIMTSTKAVSALPSGELTFDDGRTVKADLVVGADGVNSRIRDSLGLLKHNKTLRDGATRMLITRTEQERESPEHQKCGEYWSGTRRVLYTPCHRDWVYLAVVGRNDDHAASQVPVDIDTWVASFPQLESLLRRITPETEARWDPFSMVRLKSWHKGRVAIAGDAAHAQPPNLGQGACLAMSNMLALAVAADEHRHDIESGLAEWENRERPLVEHTQRWTARWSVISASCPRTLERARSRFVSWVGRRKWVYSNLAKTTAHIPTGTEHLPPSLVPDAPSDANGNQPNRRLQ